MLMARNGKNLDENLRFSILEEPRGTGEVLRKSWQAGLSKVSKVVNDPIRAQNKQTIRNFRFGESNERPGTRSGTAKTLPAKDVLAGGFRHQGL